jgi:hypothetical protein
VGWIRPGNDIRAMKRELGLECVRDAANTWSSQGRSAIDDAVFLAVMIRLLLAPERHRTLKANKAYAGGWVPDLPIRPFDEWAAVVGTPAEECARPTPGYPPPATPAPLGELLEKVGRAADQWALGDPEQPPTEAVFKDLARCLCDCGLLPWWGEKAPGAKP